MRVKWGIGINGRNFTFVYLTWTGLMFVSHKSYACLVCNFSNGLNLIHAWNLLSSPFLPAHPPVQFKTQLYAKNNFVYFDTYKSNIIGRLQKEVLNSLKVALWLLFLWFQNKNPTIFNTIRWVDGTIVSLTKRLMFQVCIIYFIISCKILCKNPFN